MSSSIEAIRQQYGESLAGKLEVLVELWDSLEREPNPKSTSTTDFFNAVHKLSGSAGLYGYNDIHQRAQAVEVILRDMKEKEQSTSVSQGVQPLRESWETLADAIKQAIEQLPSASS